MNDIHNLLREVNALHRDDWVVCVDYFLSGDSAVHISASGVLFGGWCDIEAGLAVFVSIAFVDILHVLIGDAVDVIHSSL